MNYLLLGGVFVWLIVLESVVALWVIIERIIYMITVLPSRRKALADFVKLLDSRSASFEIPASLDAFGKAVQALFNDRKLNIPALAPEGDRMVAEVEKGLVTLRIVAQTAPMLGLLGAIAGMINMLMLSASSGQSAGFDGIPTGLWQALICTAAGLVVAIPSYAVVIGFGSTADRFAREINTAIGLIAGAAVDSGIEVIS